MNLVEERRSWRRRGLLHGRPARWRAEQLAGGVARRIEASKKALEPAGVLARRVETARRLGSQIRG